ncbi:MAG: transposase family protein, partial [Bacteroidota bacterium]
MYSLERFDYKYVKQKILGYENRVDPEYLMQVVEADGSKYQIIGIDPETNSIIFISFYVILDLCSDKIIGVNCGLSENRWMVLNAFHDMAMRTGHLPSVIRIDKASPYTSNEVQSLINKTSEEYGCLWLDHEPGEPQVNGTIEKFFQDFHDKLVSDHPHYVGLSMVSATPKKRLKREVYDKAYQNKSSLLTINEIKKSLFNYLGIWNSDSRESETTSRDSNFENGEFKDALPIAHHHIARLFWKHDERKFERQRFQLNNHEYELLSFDHAMKLSSEDYDIFSNDSNPDFVYAFNKNGDYIGRPTLKPTWLNDPKRIPGLDRKEIDKRKRDRGSIIPKMKKISKSRSKRLEEIRSDDPQISHYLNKKKEESTREILNVIEYNFQLNEKNEQKDSNKSSTEN